MVVYLTHQQHGVHVAYSQQNVDECLKNGWQLKAEQVETKNIQPQRGRPKVKHGNH